DRASRKQAGDSSAYGRKLCRGRRLRGLGLRAKSLSRILAGLQGRCYAVQPFMVRGLHLHETPTFHPVGRRNLSGGKMGILAWIVLGLIAGAIAKAIMPGNDPGGIIVTMIIGIVGAFIGGFLGNMLTGVGLNGFSIQS